MTGLVAWMVIVSATWLVVACLVALIIGRAIRIADQAAAGRATARRHTSTGKDRP